MEKELVVNMINEMIRTARFEGGMSTKGINDGYHNFGELYTKITILFALVCNAYPDLAWKSTKHFDEENDPMFNGDFIVGINTPLGTASSHVKLKYWDLFRVPELERGLPYDGHPPVEDIARLFSLLTEAPDVNKSRQ